MGLVPRLMKTTSKNMNLPNKYKILKKNFRSTKEIVNFNNDFFDTVSKKINDKEYQALYREKSNNLNSKGQGYVQIESIEKGRNEEMNKSLYASKTITILKNHEICTLNLICFFEPGVFSSTRRLI